MTPNLTCPILFPYTTLFRSVPLVAGGLGGEHGPAPGAGAVRGEREDAQPLALEEPELLRARGGDDEVGLAVDRHVRSEEHTSELQSRLHLVCSLLLETKNFL